MSIKDKRVAIIVSTYNWPEALKLSIRSIFRQTAMPAEIVIADDGSGDETRQAIEELKKESPIPIKHVWQEDRGFRKSEILNEAIAVAEADYIIQIDGDIVCEKHFVEDHMAVAKAGYFVCGSRIKLSEKESKDFFEKAQAGQTKFSVSLKNPYIWSSFRIVPFRFLLQYLYRISKMSQTRGSNQSFWRSDLIKVNGYNEDFQGWGHEDAELSFRLVFAGCETRALRAAGICYHLYHKEFSKDRDSFNAKIRDKTINRKSTWCEKGLDRHLNKQR